MGQGFGDEIGKGIIRFMVFVFFAGAGVSIGLFFVVRWLLHHIAINWK